MFINQFLEKKKIILIEDKKPPFSFKDRQKS